MSKKENNWEEELAKEKRQQFVNEISETTHEASFIEHCVLAGIKEAKKQALEQAMEVVESSKIGVSRTNDPWSIEIAGIENQESFNEALDMAKDKLEQLKEEIDGN